MKTVLTAAMILFATAAFANEPATTETKTAPAVEAAAHTEATKAATTEKVATTETAKTTKPCEGLKGPELKKCQKEHKATKTKATK